MFRPFRRLAVGDRLALEPLEPRDVPATFTVTNLDDAGAGSLRQAVSDANAAAGADTVTFQAGLTGTITLTSGELLVEDDLAIVGPGAGTLTVSGNAASRVFEFYGGSVHSLSGLTLTKGFARGGGGGAVYLYSTSLTIDSCVVSDSTAPLGGGVFALRGSLAIRNSTIAGNRASKSGGGGVAAAADLILENSTVSGNVGGGVLTYLYGARTATIRNSTIVGNAGARYYSGGVDHVGNPGTTLTIESSILAGNTANEAADADLRSGFLPKGSGAPVGAGGKLREGFPLRGEQDGQDRDTGSPSGAQAAVMPTVNVTNSVIQTAPAPDTITGTDAGNRIGVDPLLGPLKDNGGPTPTMKPAAGSPAIGIGSNPAGLAFDQRGAPFVRDAGGAVDAGAVQVADPAGPAPLPQPVPLCDPADDAATCFVKKLYRDLLGRAIDTGAEPYIAFVRGGGNRQDVVDDIMGSGEHALFAVSQLYLRVLGRPGDPGGLVGYAESYRDGRTAAQIAAEMAGSDEFRRLHPDPAAFVEALYRAALGRSSVGDSGAGDYISRLAGDDSAANRAAIALAIITSDEADIRQVGDQYALLLGRRPDALGDGSARVLLHDAPVRDLVRLLLSSDEYYSQGQS